MDIRRFTDATIVDLIEMVHPPTVEQEEEAWEATKLALAQHLLEVLDITIVASRRGRHDEILASAFEMLAEEWRGRANRIPIKEF